MNLKNTSNVIETKNDAKNTERGGGKGKSQLYNTSGFYGYPGLKNTAKNICMFIPKCKIFVEPFAGLGRISKHVTAEKYILNDLSEFAIQYLEKNFSRNPKMKITSIDYYDCIINNDSEDTLFFIDPPWIDDAYSVNPLPAHTEPNKETYKKLRELLNTIKGNWFVAGKADGPLLKWGYHHKEIKSDKRSLFGYKARTYLVSNKPFKNYVQESLL